MEDDEFKVTGFWKDWAPHLLAGVGGVLASHYIRGMRGKVRQLKPDWPSSSPQLALHRARALENAAILAHEANRGYCESLGDASQVSWLEAPAWQRESALAGVRAIYEKPSTTPEESHEGWLAKKLEDGWCYGEVKDAEKKTHPCIVPYEQLPADQRTKDALFGAVVRTSLKHWGVTVVEWRAIDDEPVQVESFFRSRSDRQVGAHLAFNRAVYVCLEASRILFRASGKPVAPGERYTDKTHNVAIQHFQNTVSCCVAAVSAEHAYQTFVASRFPRLHPNWDTPEMAFPGMHLLRRCWHVTFQVVQAVMNIEGIVFDDEIGVGVQGSTRTWVREKPVVSEEAIVASEEHHEEVGRGG